MDNLPHVRLVDSHPESIRGDHYAALVIFPTVLPDRLFFPVQSGMKEIGRYSGLLQEESCLFCLFPALLIYPENSPSSLRFNNVDFILILLRGQKVLQQRCFWL